MRILGCYATIAMNHNKNYCWLMPVNNEISAGSARLKFPDQSLAD